MPGMLRKSRASVLRYQRFESISSSGEAAKFFGSWSRRPAAGSAGPRRAHPRNPGTSGQGPVTCSGCRPPSLQNGGVPPRLDSPADRHEVVHANALHDEKLALAIGLAVHVMRRLLRHRAAFARQQPVDVTRRSRVDHIATLASADTAAPDTFAALLCRNPLPRDFAMFLDFPGPPRCGDEDHALVS